MLRLEWLGGFKKSYSEFDFFFIIFLLIFLTGEMRKADHFWIDLFQQYWSRNGDFSAIYIYFYNFIYTILQPRFVQLDSDFKDHNSP